MLKTNIARLEDTFLNTSEVSIVKRVLIYKTISQRWLSLSLLKVNNIYYLDVCVLNKQNFFPTIRNNTSSRFKDF